MRKIIGLVLALSVAAAGIFVSGCSDNSSKANNENQPPISSEPQETPVEVTLYFSDDQAMHLVTEQREVSKEGEALEEIVIRELIKGPKNPKHNKTIPQEAELMSVSVVEGVAYVNFSKEFSTKHWGGSTGETMTLYSVTNSLCELEGIEKVQFLLEGDKMQSLAGHYDTSNPLEPQDI
ncbi:MAG: GerMN domain-containing protein [Clostridiales bacterium]|nr:GerMN domain-containing protein [Clostridiales bacterium]MCF8023211.1 GerMN domain-containing protein [Clostridiales bacterium]